MYDMYYCEECMDKRRRIVRVSIDPNTIVDMLSGRTVVVEGLPEGCEFISADFYAPANRFEIYVRHSSFDRIADGVEIPLKMDIVFNLVEK